MSMSISAHQSGMSALWHSSDSIPDAQIRPAEVHPSFEGMPMPDEEHQSPKGDLAFQKMEQIYEVAHEQMDAGLKAQAFLYGAKPPAEAHGVQALTDTDDPTKIIHDEQARVSMASKQVNASRDSEAARYQMRAENNEVKKKSASQSTPKTSSNGDALGKAKKAEQMIKMAEGLGVSMLSVVATQALDGGMTGMIGEAASVVKAISTANVAVGLTQPMTQIDEDQSVKSKMTSTFDLFDAEGKRII